MIPRRAEQMTTQVIFFQSSLAGCDKCCRFSHIQMGLVVVVVFFQALVDQTS